MLTDWDLAAFEAYCWAFSRFKKMQAHIEQYGDLVTSPKGSVQQSPYVSMANMALKQMNTYLSKFGLSPADRTRISIDPAKKDGIEEFLFGNQA